MLVNKSLSILPLVLRMKRKWKPSIKQLWQLVARTMVLQVSAVSIIQVITLPTSLTQMEIISRQSAIKNKNRKEKKRVEEKCNNY